MSKLRRAEGGILMFYCPGCKCSHAFDSRWTFDGNMEAPTFSPSLLVGPYWTLPPGWDYETAKKAGRAENDPKTGRLPDAIQVCCHSFVRAGMIEFLGDSTHELAGKTVAMEDVE